MKVFFETEVDHDIMFDQESVDKDFDGSWLKAIQWLFEQEGLGIFDGDFKITGVADFPATTDNKAQLAKDREDGNG